MICLQCDSEEFVLKQDAVIEQEFKGELLRIQMPAFACAKCGRIAVDLQQTDELRRRTADVYRKKHGLLTSEEIKALRQLLSKSQREFAALLSVGEASIKRWETWLVQERSSDELIRMKCEEALREQLVQKSAVEVWITPASEPHKKTVTLRPAYSSKAATEKLNPQMLLCESDTYMGPSPPGCGTGAFSFSMLSTMSSTESIEKENESLIVKNYVIASSTFSFAT